jgi:hypothetical protein
VRGKTITGLRVYLGARRRAGYYNTSVQLQIAAHGQSTRGGSPTAITGQMSFSIPPGWGGGWLALDTGWGDKLAAGGGLFIVGGDYLGINGPGEDAQSGLLELTWRS